MRCVMSWSSVLLVVLAGGVVRGGTTPSDGTPGADSALDLLVEQALASNRSLAALQARIRALEHRREGAGAWPNPKLVLAYQNVPLDSLALGHEPMSMVQARLEQRLPFPGKNDLREEVVNERAQAQRWRLAERRAMLRAEIKRTYFQLGLSRQMRVVTKKHVGLVAQLADVARKRYEVGGGRQQDLIRLGVLEGRLKDELRDFDERERALAAALNAAAHRSTTTPIATPAVFHLGPEPMMHVGGLVELAVLARPALKGFASAAAAERAAARLAEYDAVPDLTLFAAYGYRKDLPRDNPGRDLVTVGIAMPIPLFYGARNAAPAAEHRELASAHEEEKALLIDEIHAAMERHLARWNRAVTKVTTYRDELLPEARNAVEAALAAYQVGRTDFSSLYEAELELLRFEKAIIQATADALTARASAEAVIGEDLP